ncbi:MAG: hypothetical protein ACREMB_21680 [Candidatus Rokuibacteriota bacterium]
MRDWVMLVIGTALGIVAVTADLIGVGEHPGFGWRQALGAGVAVFLVVSSAIRIVRRDRR